MFVFNVFCGVLCSFVVVVNCYEIIKKGVSSAEATQIVKIHNEYRIKLAKGQVYNQPSAGNLKKMIWDKTLGAEAQKSAEECKEEYKKIYDKTNTTTPGQNIHKYHCHTDEFHAEWKKTLQLWFDENVHYIYRRFSVNHNETESYTQMIWSSTYLVGCGYAFCVNEKEIYKIHVCNYSPRGNVRDQMPYRLGNDCPNLC